jgi:glycosyltransferase involved in cell wall biosynthesis
MRIALISDWFAEKMGYSENCLPKALAALGHEVHLVTSDAQPYFNLPTYSQTYEPFLGPAIVRQETKVLDGYLLHRLPHTIVAGRPGIRGLGRRLADIRPEIVQTFDAMSPTTIEAAWRQTKLGYRLFLETHLHASVFEPDRRRRHQNHLWAIYRATIGRLVVSRTTKMYPISQDTGEIAAEFLGFPAEKMEICSLGVDTQHFRPPTDSEHAAARNRLGFAPDEVVAIYTGRFAASKGPLILAEAADSLVRGGRRIRGLFVGGGTKDETAALKAMAGCVVMPFVPAVELPAFYWAADIGVWPRQESTSQLDAAACGLPIIIADSGTVRDRVEGNGLTYREGDAADLARQIESLSEPGKRKQLGSAGNQKMSQQYSWLAIAGRRAQDYTQALAEGNSH